METLTDLEGRDGKHLRIQRRYALREPQDLFSLDVMGAGGGFHGSVRFRREDIVMIVHALMDCWRELGKEE